MNERLDALLIHLKSQVGFELCFTSPDLVTSATFRQYFQAIGDFNPVYFEPQFAKKTGHDRLIGPPTLVCESEQFKDLFEASSILSERTYFMGYWYDWLRAGNNYEFYQSVRVGDLISTKRRFEDVWLKEGKSGNHIFRRVVIHYSNQEGESLARNEEIMFVTIR
tara:strand:+ start:221 stop:715 length:495 start_codon:yes stop_codon:yes gene_type:complete